MVKNTTGGKHHKKQKRKTETSDEVRNFPWADNVMTFFGKVTLLFGGNMLEVRVEERKEEYKCRIPGCFRKRVWIGKGDLVLVHHDNDTNVWEVVYVYKPVEANIIQQTEVWSDEENDIAFGTDLDIETI